MLLFVPGIVELLRADLLNITNHMGQETVGRILPLRRLLDAQGRQLQLMRVYPRHIGQRGALLDQDRFKGGL